MTSMNLVLRPSSRGCHFPGSLSLRLIHNRQVKTVTLPGCRIYPEEWNKDKQVVVYPENNPDRAATLEEVYHRINDELELVNTYLQTLQKKGWYNVEDLVRLYRERKDASKLLGYTETLINTLERRGQYRTAKAYRTVTKGLVKFNHNTDIPLTQINSNLIKDFEKHLRDAGRLPNTISFYMRNLRAIFNKAVNEKRIVKPKESPFAGTYTSVAKTRKRSLSLEEIKALYDLDLGKLLKETKPDSHEYKVIEDLHHARSYFGFCFYARGMSFVDMAFLRKDNIRGEFIRYVRKKTGQEIDVRLTPEIQEIIDRFAPEVKNSPYVFPIIRDKGKGAYRQYENALQKQNCLLKKIAELAGIHKPVSTHCARHSWATAAKYNNFPIAVISEALGHTSERTTQIYLDSLDNSVLDTANQIIISSITK
ncbi:site-specific integrase [Parabacteroides sp. PF5-6]|uniref:site-specific integrase n=1 Tax=Parabacteroides sp. PF5-6 TaxID=1742403 RepID=UPI002406932B|nr:site-specific integrase [Parabacteroides sp. PF5-6]MDF9830674.1 integrase [Parabacteroides sp. PF5-6]